jgi:hypothetical protein
MTLKFYFKGGFVTRPETFCIMQESIRDPLPTGHDSGLDFGAANRDHILRKV